MSGRNGSATTAPRRRSADSAREVNSAQGHRKTSLDEDRKKGTAKGEWQREDAPAVDEAQDWAWSKSAALHPDFNRNVTREELEMALAQSGNNAFKGEAGAALTTTFFQRLATRSPGKSAFDFKDMLFLMYPEKSSRDLAFMELETRPPPPVVEETADPVKEADVDDMFSIWDEDGSGTLDKDEFKEMLRKLGVTDDDELERYFNEIDLDGGGTVSIQELKEWWISK